MVDSEVWRLATRLSRASPPEVVLAALARTKDPDARFLVAAVVDPTSQAQLAKALAALKALVSRDGRASYRAAVREPRHLAAALAVLKQWPPAHDAVASYLVGIVCDGSARSLVALAPAVRVALAGDNFDIDSLADCVEQFGRTPGTRRLAVRLRAALAARMRASPAGGINKLIGVAGKLPARFSLWLEPLEGRGGIDLLVNAPGGAWIQLDGVAEVLDLPAALDGLVEYYRSISGEHPDWDDSREAMNRQGKSLLRMTIERWGPVATGGFPARLAT